MNDDWLFLLKFYLGLNNPVAVKIYEKTNHQIEKWSEILCVWFAKILPPAFILPKCVAGLYLYTTADLNENDVLELPLPMM